MKNKTLSLCILFFIISCLNKNKEYPKQGVVEQKNTILITNKSLDSLLFYVSSFTPSTIDINKLELFEKFDVNFIFNQDYYKNKSKKNHIATIIILKQYLFHLKRSNQSYDIKSMRNGNAKIIIDYFFDINKIDTTQESISSSIAYIKLTENESKDYDKKISEILQEIENELKRIENYNKSIIEH
jgi:hypothetical protein